jgi:ABC-type glycerol-3-phosphate transport system substrate-binding protein
MFREDFEKLSGIKVELIGVPSEEFTEKLLVEFLAGTAKYDTVEYYQGDTGMFIPYLADLAPYVDEWNYTDIRGIHPVYFWIQCLRGDKIVALPFDSDCRMLHYRPKMLALAGYDYPPETWDQALEYCQKLEDVLPEGVYPIGFPGARHFGALKAWMDIAGSRGVEFFKPGWEVGVNTPDGVAALKRMIELAQFAPPGLKNWGYSECRESWLSGNLAMVQQWQCVGRQAYDPEVSEIALEVPRPETAPLPQSTAPNARRAYSVVQGSSASLTKASPNKKAAALWLFFLNGTETQFVYSISGTGVETGSKWVLENPVYQTGFPPAKTWLYELNWANTEMLWITEWSRLEAIGTMLINYGLVGNYSPEETMARMEESFHRVMDRAGYYEPGAPETPSAYWPDEQEAFMERMEALFQKLGV